MTKLFSAIAATALTLTAPLALAQMPPPPTAPVAPAPAVNVGAKFVPQALKSPDIKGLAAAVKQANSAWDHLDPKAIAATWTFPATVFTTDGQGNPVYVPVDDATLEAALAAAFAAVPKPAPGEPSAKVNFTQQKIEWQSNTLAVVSHQAFLVQGRGKNVFRQIWKVSQIWTKDASGWKIRGYVAGGWGDLLKH